MSSPPGVFVISLPRAVERRKSIANQLADTPHTFIEAVDGRYLSSQGLAQAVDPARFAFWEELRRPNVVATAMSHRQAYEAIVAEELPWAIVLEDDALLGRDFAHRLAEIGQSAVPGEAILFFFQSDHRLQLRLAGPQPASPPRLYRVEGTPYFGGAVGYLVTLDAARKLLALQTPIFSTADDWAQFLSQDALSGLRITVPFLVDHKGFESEVGYAASTRATKLLQRLLRSLPILALPVRFARRRLARRRQRFEILEPPAT